MSEELQSQPTDLIDRLLEAGAWITVPDETNSWCDFEIDNRKDLLRWLSDPEKFVASQYETTVELLREYLDSHGRLRCGSETAKGGSCQIIMDDARHLSDWLDKRAARKRCHLHDTKKGPTPNEAPDH